MASLSQNQNADDDEEEFPLSTPANVAFVYNSAAHAEKQMDLGFMIL